MIIPQILPNVNKTKVLILSKKNEITKYIMLKNDNKGIYIKIVNKWVVF